MKRLTLVLIFVLCTLVGCSKNNNDESIALTRTATISSADYSSNDQFIIDTYRKVLTETLTLEQWEQYFNILGYSLVPTNKEGIFGKYTSYEVYFPHDYIEGDTGLMSFSFYELDDTITENSKYTEMYVVPFSDDSSEEYTLDMELARIRNELGYQLRDSNSLELKGIWKKGTYEAHSISRGVSLLATEDIGEYKELDYALIRDSSIGTELYKDEDINAEFISTQIKDILELNLTANSLLKYMDKYCTEPKTLKIGEDLSYIWGNAYENPEATAGLPVNYWELSYVSYSYMTRVSGNYQLSSKDPELYISNLYDELSTKYNVRLEDFKIVFEDTNFNGKIKSAVLNYKINNHCITMNLEIYLNS